MKRLSLLAVALGLLLAGSPAEAAKVSGSGSGLPAVGSEGDCLLVVSGVPGWDACPGAGSGAPTDATYWTGSANGTLSAEVNLGALGTGLVINTAGTPSIYAGQTCTNQVVRVLGASGAATCVTITSAFVDSSIALTGGHLGQFAATTSDQLAEVLSNETGSGGGFVRATAPTIDSPIIATKVNLPSGTALPGSPSAGDVFIVTDDSAAGACDSAAGSARTVCRYNGSAWQAIGDGGAGAGIGGSVGSTDNAVPRANGTGGATLQASGVVIDDSNNVSIPGTISIGTSGVGVWAPLEGTAPGAGADAGRHNTYFDSADSLLKSHENGGSVVTYHSTANPQTTASTPSANDNDTSIATTAYVQTELTAYASDTVTFTTKTIDCTAASNVCTIYKYMQLDLVGVAAGTAGHVWDDDPLSTTCTAASTAGTNQTRAFCTFPDSDGEYGKQLKLSLPTGYVAGTLQFRVSWKTTGTGNFRPQLQTLCYASDAASDTAYSNSTYITAGAGTSGRFNQTAWTTATDTGCDAEETMAIRFSRNRTEASDTLNATADVEFVGVRYAVAQ